MLQTKLRNFRLMQILLFTKKAKTQPSNGKKIYMAFITTAYGFVIQVNDLKTEVQDS